jgi:hypothetical protein
MSIHLPPRPSSRSTISLRDYVKRFCNARNGIPHIQDIDIINAFRNGVSDLKTVEEIAMKKPKTVDDLLVVADICIEAFKARARLLESRGKGPSRRRDDREVNTVEQGDQNDRGGYRYRRKQYSHQKKRRPFRCPDNAEKWCEIHHTDGHDLEECKTFLDQKRCRLQQRRHRKTPTGESNAGRSPTEMSIWRKSI